MGQRARRQKGEEMAVEDVVVVSVPVPDEERAREFYVEKLGVELSRDDAVGLEAVIRDSDGNRLVLQQA